MTGKAAIMMILFAFWAEARAEEQDVDLAEALGERALNAVECVDDGEALDGTTLGKGGAAGGATRSAPSSARGGGRDIDLNKRDGSLRGADGRRVFGGTTKILSGNGKPIQSAPKAPSFWDADGSSATVFKRAEDRGLDLTDRAGKLRNKEGRRVFGGTTQILSGNGKAVQQEAKIPSFWDNARSSIKTKALCGPGLAPKRMGGSMPRIRAGPFAFADQVTTPMTSSDIIVAVCVLGMVMSIGLIAKIRSRSGPSDREQFLAAY
jgi:hypothetical protein